MMKPKVARIAAYTQVAILAGAIPTAIVAGIVGAFFDWEIGAIAAIGTIAFAGGVSALFIPVAGLVVSWCWFGEST